MWRDYTAIVPFVTPYAALLVTLTLYTLILRYLHRYVLCSILQYENSTHACAKYQITHFCNRINVVYSVPAAGRLAEHAVRRPSAEATL